MRGYVRFILAAMLAAAAAVAAVGSARGEEGFTNEQEFNDGTIKWRVRFSTYNLGRCAIGPSGSSKLPSTVTIPSEVFGTTVVGIIECAFMGHSEITEVRIPPSVEMIGHDAFWDCSGLMSVTIPSSVTSIRGGAFADCSGLTSVTISAGVTTIGDGAFSGCSRLQRIEVAPGNPRYHDEDGVLFGLTWSNVSQRNDVKALICCPAGRAGEYRIPDDVEVVESASFMGCNGLTSVIIPSSVTSIRGGAFADCNELQRFKVAPENKEFNEVEGVLYSKDMKVLFSYPGGRTGAYEIPQGVKDISWAAFQGSSKLTRVTIPRSVEGCHENPFQGCNELQEFIVDAANEFLCAKDGVLYSKDMKVLVSYPAGHTGSYVIPNGVTLIMPFDVYGSLSQLVIPRSIEEIYSGNFQGGGLIGVAIPVSVRRVSKGSFYCKNLKEVYWLAGMNTEIFEDSFVALPAGATLYVRPGEKLRIESEEWAKRFSRIVEGHVVTFRDADWQPVGEQLVKPNGKARALDMQDKNGNAVVWLLNGAPYDFNAPVRGDLTLQVGGSSTAVESALLAGVQAVSNPVVDVLELRGMGNAARVEVYSVAGVRVHAGALRGEERVQVDARGWASGVYVVRVVAHDGAKTLRVVKRD